MRLDAIVRKKYPNLTRRQVHEAIELGWIGDGAQNALKPSSIVKSEKSLNFQILDKNLKLLKLGTEVKGIGILFQGEDFLVLHKPQGIASVPILLNELPSVTSWVRKQFPEVNLRFEKAQPELAVHRLDTDTAGILVVALNPKAHRIWRDLFSKHQIEKEYVAWVWGNFPKGKTTLKNEIYVGKSKAKTHAKIRSQKNTKKQLAAAEVECLEVDLEKQMSKVKVTICTGLRHQVRVQLAEYGFPLIGDSKYDKLFLERKGGFKQHWLWATKLSCSQGAWVSPLPVSWRP